MNIVHSKQSIYLFDVVEMTSTMLRDVIYYSTKAPIRNRSYSIKKYIDESLVKVI